MQWPVDEVEALRGKKPVSLKDLVVKRGQHVEVTGLQTAQVSQCAYHILLLQFHFLFKLVHSNQGDIF
jgi:hypothetical protein